MVDLAGGLQQPDAASIAARIGHHVRTAGDGYAARDLLAHEACRAVLTDARERTFLAFVEAAGLSTATMPESLMGDLHVAVQMSVARIATHFGTRLLTALALCEESTER
jgi:hypothetical protein